MRTTAAALGAFLALLLASVALAPTPGAAQAPQGPQTILTDPAGDQAVTPGAVVVQPPAMAQVDLLGLTASLSGRNLTFVATTTGSVTATETFTLRFSVAKGPTSPDESTANGQAFTIAVTGTAVTGVTGASAASSGSSLTLILPLAAIQAVGGDVLGNLTLAAADTDGGSAPPPVTQDDTTATDQAPNAGAATYAIPRPPIQSGIAFSSKGGTVHQRTLCPGGRLCAGTFEDTTFTGATATTRDGNATVTFDLQVSNAGTDADVFNLGVSAQPRRGAAELDTTSLRLARGATGDAKLTVTLQGQPTGIVSVTVQATSTRGAASQVEARIDVKLPVPPAPPAAREPVPAQLGFLTPLATGMGLDKALGEFAELALLALLLLLAVVAAYLVLFLTRTPWVRVQVTPKRLAVAPGAMADFKVQLSPRRKRTFVARGVLRDDGGWRAGLLLGRDAPAGDARKPVEVSLGRDAKVDATLRVHVPADADAHERETVELDVVPVDAEGAERPSHRARAKVTVEAAPTGYASAQDIRLTEVRHDPVSPRPGATVTTTATVRNAGLMPARLRVVLLLDGAPALEERLDVPPQAEGKATLPWTAGAGTNQVKVQIFLA